MKKFSGVVTIVGQAVDQTATSPEDNVNKVTNNNKAATKGQPLDDAGAERLPVVSDATDQVGTEEEDEPVEEERTFRTIARSLEDLPIDSIMHYDSIPDYVTPTEAEHPIINRTTEGIFCLDGWNLVEAARSSGETTILCEVDELDAHSDEELALRKGGVRSMTRGGISIYPETLRVVQHLLSMLMNSDEDLRIYGHGQRRYGHGFIKNREEDVRHILAMRLSRDRDTINLYITHGEYLNPEALQTLVDGKASKKFFEKVQIKKREEVKNLRGRNILSHGRITEAISKFILDEFEKFLPGRGSGENVPTPGPAQPQTEVVQTNDPVSSSVTPDENNDDDDSPASEEETPDPSSEINPDEPVTIETIKTGTLGVSRRLEERVSKDAPLAELESSLQAELQNIMKLLSMITHLNNAGK